MTSVTNFAKNLYEDLKESRLWPLALGLVVALVAVPVVLSKPAKNGAPATTASATAAQGTFSLPELEPAVTVSNASGSSERKSVRRLTRKNPFEPLVKPKVQTTGSTDTGSDVPGGSSAGVGAGSGGGPPGSTDAGSPGSTPTTGSGDSSGVTYFTYVAKVKFGELGETKSKTLQQLRALPSSDNPVLVFMGATLDGEKAVFLVSSSSGLEGDGTCKPSNEECVFLYMDPGDSETFEVAGSDGSLKTYELKLTSIDSKVLDQAPSAASSSKQKGGARTSTASRSGKRLRKAQAGRYFNAFGQIGF